MPTNNSSLAQAAAKNSLGTVEIGPAVAMDMTYTAMADAVGMQMHNSVETQHNGQTTATATLAPVCTLIIASFSPK